MECPNCHVSVSVSEQLYGALYTCNDCRAVYFINFEGQPEFGEVSEEVLSDIISEPEPVNLSPLPMAESEIVSVESSAEALTETPPEVAGDFEGSLEPLVDSINMVDFDNQLIQQSSDFAPDANLAPLNNDIQNLDLMTNFENQNLDSSSALTSQPAEYLEEKEEVTSSGIQIPDLSNTDNNNLDLNSSVQPKAPVSKPLSSAKSKDFNEIAKEISDFGNADVQLAALNYDLKISGLDTSEIKLLFQEAIEDSKLGWDANEIMRNITNGEVSFDKLNPAKAYILARRLQFLDIEKKWQQNAIT